MLGKEAERVKLNVCLYTADTAACQDVDRLDLEGKKRKKMPWETEWHSSIGGNMTFRLSKWGWKGKETG